MVIMMCCALRAQTSMGLRTVAKAVGIILDILGVEAKIPCHQTISDWMQRLGVGEYRDGCKRFSSSKYALIIDESISVGSQKLLIIQAVPAKFPGRPLCLGDSAVVGMHVASSWSAEEIGKKCAEAERKIGHAAEYTITDCGHNVVAGSSKIGNTHHFDISHTFGTICKRRYEDEDDFAAYVELLGKKRLELHLTDNALLLPPKQRATCRFMNIASWVDWSHDMLEVFPSLEPRIKEKFSFILPYKKLIVELKAVVDCLRKLETWCKHMGFSRSIAEKCKEHVKERLVNGPGSTMRMKWIAAKVLEYFWREESKLDPGLGRINISSDVIESTFGLFKSRKSPDKLVGVSSSVLSVPLYAALATKDKTKKYDFKSCMESIRMVDVQKWKEENLLGNLSVQRRKILNQSA